MPDGDDASPKPPAPAQTENTANAAPTQAAASLQHARALLSSFKAMAAAASSAPAAPTAAALSQAAADGAALNDSLLPALAAAIGQSGLPRTLPTPAMTTYEQCALAAAARIADALAHEKRAGGAGPTLNCGHLPSLTGSLARLAAAATAASITAADRDFISGLLSIKWLTQTDELTYKATPALPEVPLTHLQGVMAAAHDDAVRFAPPKPTGPSAQGAGPPNAEETAGQAPLAQALARLRDTHAAEQQQAAIETWQRELQELPIDMTLPQMRAALAEANRLLSTDKAAAAPAPRRAGGGDGRGHGLPPAGEGGDGRAPAQAGAEHHRAPRAAGGGGGGGSSATSNPSSAQRGGAGDALQRLRAPPGGGTTPAHPLPPVPAYSNPGLTAEDLARKPHPLHKLIPDWFAVEEVDKEEGELSITMTNGSMSLKKKEGKLYKQLTCPQWAEATARAATQLYAHMGPSYAAHTAMLNRLWDSPYPNHLLQKYDYAVRTQLAINTSLTFASDFTLTWHECVTLPYTQQQITKAAAALAPAALGRAPGGGNGGRAQHNAQNNTTNRASSGAAPPRGVQYDRRAQAAPPPPSRPTPNWQAMADAGDRPQERDVCHFFAGKAAEGCSRGVGCGKAHFCLHCEAWRMGAKLCGCGKRSSALWAPGAGKRKARA
jgi:hypothetical protein